MERGTECICAECGRQFAGNRKKLYCGPECRRAAKNKRDRLYYRYKKYHDAPPEPAKKRPKPSRLEEDVKRARALGISYGEYKARQYIAQMPRITAERTKNDGSNM